MSDRRRFQWRSGRLPSSPISDGWALTLTERDPQIPNLPLESPAAGGTTVEPAAGALTFAGFAPTISVSANQ